MNDPLLTIGMAVYGQPLMLAEWFKRFFDAGGDRAGDVEVVVVDDCGDPPATAPMRPFIRQVRITENKPWNQGEARNLAALQARGRVLLMLDPDMTFPKGEMIAGEVVRFVRAAEALPKGCVMRPRLRHADGTFDASSPNVYLIHRTDFLRCGYDLCYAGHKGYSDVELSNVWRKLYKEKACADLFFDFHHDALIPDAQVKSLSRDYTHNRKLFHERHRRHAKIGTDAFIRERSSLVTSPWEEIKWPG